LKRDRHQDASAHHRIDRKKLGIPEPNGLLKLTAAKQEIVVAWNDGQPEISWEKPEGIELEINRGTGWKLLLFNPASSIAGPRLLHLRQLRPHGSSAPASLRPPKRRRRGSLD
jgi:hypothetical protein